VIKGVQQRVDMQLHSMALAVGHKPKNNPAPKESERIPATNPGTTTTQKNTPASCKPKPQSPEP
jgi:hypothetical protein